MKKPRTETGVTKACTECGVVKDLCDFYKRRQGKDSRCKACSDIYKTGWIRDHPDSRRRTSQKYYKTLPPEQRAQRNLISKMQRRARVLKDPVGTKTRKRNSVLKSLYGLTQEQYNAMSDAQGGACATCGSVEKLFVDHNHTTDVVRELLCQACNFALGQAKENPDILRAMIAYLKKHNGF